MRLIVPALLPCPTIRVWTDVCGGRWKGSRYRAALDCLPAPAPPPSLSCSCVPISLQLVITSAIFEMSLQCPLPLKPGTTASVRVDLRAQGGPKTQLLSPFAILELSVPSFLHLWTS